MLSTEYQKILHRTRPVSGRHPMAVEKRAKQFAPFDALRGLREALAKKEREHERQERGEVSEETAAEIEATLIKLKKGDRVRALIFDDGYYVAVEGQVTNFDVTYRYIKVEDGKIPFSDLYDLKIV